MNFVSLFAGIGGIDLGLENAGLTCVAQVEINAYCREVLATHWPEVPQHDDVRTFPEWWGSTRRPNVDLVAGGFPCQPFSRAGYRQGMADERWGWPWMLDAIRVLRPQYVLVENVSALLEDGAAFGTVLADLHTLGFDAEWGCLTACALGAPHTRERLFVVAYPNGERRPTGVGVGLEGWPVQSLDGGPPTRIDPRDWMAAAGGVGRMADGIPDPLEPARVKALGNAVVPPVAEYFGHIIRTHNEGARS